MANHKDLQRDIALIVYSNAHFGYISDDFINDGQVLGMRTGPGLEFQKVVEEVVEYIEEKYGVEEALQSKELIEA